MHRFVLLLAAFELCAGGVEAAAPVQNPGKWHTLDGKPPHAFFVDFDPEPRTARNDGVAR